MTDSPNPATASDFVTKLLATFDSISGYTILAVALACAAVLALPSPLLGIDLGPLRTGMIGAIIAGIGILAACLVAAKILRAAHEAHTKRFENGRGRPVIIIRRAMSFWQGSQSPAGPVLQIHIQGVLTNPNVRRALVISRLEVFRLTPLGIFSKRECLNFSLGDEAGGILDLQAVPPRRSTMLSIHHLHPGPYPKRQRHVWIGLQLVDQRHRRSRKFLRVRHVKTTA